MTDPVFFPGTTRITAPPPAINLPVNYEAEQGLLGALMVNNRALERVRDFLEPEHFADPAHGRIFDAIRKTVDKGHQANPVTLNAFFQVDGGLAEVGGPAYLVKLAGAIVAIVNAEDYGRTILEHWQRRTAITTMLEMIGRCAQPEVGEDGGGFLEEAEERFHRIATRSEKRRGLIHISVAVQGALEQIEAAYKSGGSSGLATGLRDLDALSGGLHPGEVTIIAARPSMGKTDLAVNVSAAVAEAGKSVGIFSLEMSAEEITKRMLARLSTIPADRQRGGRVSHHEMLSLAEASRQLDSLTLHIDDTPAPTVDAISARARRLQRRRGLDLIVVDYLQLIAPGNSRNRRNANRTEDVTEISRALKVMAKEIGVPVIALSQLSRQVESREDKRPQLSDLRESGAIEQDADAVMFLYREEYYASREEPQQKTGQSASDYAMKLADHNDRLRACQGIAEVIVAKNRMGPTGTAKLYYLPAQSRFGNLAVVAGAAVGA